MDWESKNTVIHGLGELEHSHSWTLRVRTQSSMDWELELSHAWTVTVRTQSSIDWESRKTVIHALVE